jgi:hypothetical protein
MRATDFERRHPTWIRHGLIAAAVATYLFDPDDVVWRFIRASPDRRPLEHGIFLVATILIGTGAVLCTKADAFGRREETAGSDQPIPGDLHSGRIRVQCVGEFLYAVGFASLVPLAGFVLLVCGELLRIVRLVRFEVAEGLPNQLTEEQSAVPLREAGADLGIAFRQQAAKWGIFVSMIVFSITLRDRLVEILACASGAVWAMLNLPTPWKGRA